jgi:hypothetical protein
MWGRRQEDTRKREGRGGRRERRKEEGGGRREGTWLLHGCLGVVLKVGDVGVGEGEAAGG